MNTQSHKSFTEMTATVTKANIARALQVGFSPMEYVVPVGQPRDCQLNLHCIML